MCVVILKTKIKTSQCLADQVRNVATLLHGCNSNWWFDIVGWVTQRISNLYKPACVIPDVLFCGTLPEMTA